ncbi:agrin-like [Ptychodera flava]|uniref:agrin-like n=1 Tax=Ptychodera flava TaxID=63121 RepID=UPI003969F418
MCDPIRASLIVLLAVLTIWTKPSFQQIETCKEKSMEQREEQANVVLSGFIRQVYRKPRSKMYSCEVRVVRVFKGDSVLNGNMEGHSPFAPAMLMIDGFGDPTICENTVNTGDTRLFLLERQKDGNLKLNSSVVRITMNNLDRAEAAVSDVPFVTREPTTEGPCARVLCGFGAVCQVDDKGNGICVCPEICSAVFAPVCGSDSVTYISECHLRVASCSQRKRITTESQGQCGTNDPCATKECQYGALCEVSGTGNTAVCVCPEKCSEADNFLVCGSDGNNYDNECELRKMACQSKTDIHIQNQGPCDPCDGVECKKGSVCKIDDDRSAHCRCRDKCRSDNQPVCASDGQTYDSECLMQREACVKGIDLQVVSRSPCTRANNPCDVVDCPFGSCHIDPDSGASCVCHDVCPRIYKPVCGSDGVSYNSECEMEKAGCDQNQIIAKEKDGPCETSDDKLQCDDLQCDFGATCVLNRNGEARCDCDLGCIDEDAPVCGSDGITYSNTCQLQLASCQQQKEIMVTAEEPCSSCEEMTCKYGAICDPVGLDGAKCICPELCVQVDSPVCGSDGTTYDNECELQVKSCQKQMMITVVAQGPCDLCSQVKCDYGAVCDRGKCICPSVCPAIYSPLCGSDGKTYENECELKRASCRQRKVIQVLDDGECEDIYSGSGSGEFPTDEEEGSGDEFVGCDDNTCRYGGACMLDVDGAMMCSCELNCEAMRSPVCGSDGMTYGNKCELKLAMCEKQMSITVEREGSCEGIVMEACDGEPALVNDVTGEEYFCGEGENHSDCPAGSYCHQPFDKCCAEQISHNCEDSVFGCCPDGKTQARGFNGGGCPGSCECHDLGSYLKTCDPQTRQCSCKPGVGGQKCDRCEPGYWDFRGIQKENSGCRPCSCSRGGSVRDDCDQMTGECICKDGVTGAKCDVCPSDQIMGPTGCRDVDAPTKETGADCGELQCSYGAICEIKTDGTAQCSCPSVCTADYSPVCGTDGQTYGNECQMSTFACRVQQNIQIANTGPCETTLITPTIPIGGCSQSRYGCCPDGYSVSSGPNGEGCPEGSACTSSPCMHGGTCVNDDGTELGYVCQCPAGKGGPVCNTDVTFYLPSFAGTSYIAFHTMKGFFSVDIEMEFRSLSEDGLLLFNGQKEDGKGDYLSLAIRQGFVEMRYDLGSGPAVLKSTVPVVVNQWHKLKASRNKRDGELSVDDEPDVTGFSPPKLSGLNVELDLFIGSAPEGTDEVYRRVGVNGGFNGCLKSLRVNGISYSLNFPGPDVLYGRQVGECGENPCKTRPCQNGATCIASDAESFKCICIEPYLGPLCADVFIDPCEGHMCAAGSTCKGLVKGGYMCLCPLGKKGEMCDMDIPPPVDEIYIPEFSGESFIERPGLNGQFGKRIKISVVFLTKTRNGMVFYNGQLTDGKGDFISLNLVDGYLEFRYDLGSGPAEIRSEDRVSLDKWHSVTVMRTSRDGEMKIDDLPPVTGQSQGSLGQLNLKESLWLGGSDDYAKFARKAGITNGLVGAIQKFVVAGEEIEDLMEGALQGVEITNFDGHICNTRPCQNEGMCVPELELFSCKCKAGFVGDTCEGAAIMMTPTAPPVINYDAPVRFEGNSFYTYPNSVDSEQRQQRTNNFEVTFRTSAEDGTVLWNGVSPTKSGDYIGIAVTDGKVEFAFNLGSGPVSIMSTERVNDNEWHTVLVSRNLRDGTLQVDGGEAHTGQTKRGTTQLDISGTLYIGGSNTIQPGLSAGYKTDFTGCIKDVKIRGKSLHLYYDAKDQQPEMFCPLE